MLAKFPPIPPPLACEAWHHLIAGNFVVVNSTSAIVIGSMGGGISPWAYGLWDSDGDTGELHISPNMLKKHIFPGANVVLC